jgi:hypothetical protein
MSGNSNSSADSAQLYCFCCNAQEPWFRCNIGSASDGFAIVVCNRCVPRLKRPYAPLYQRNDGHGGANANDGGQRLLCRRCYELEPADECVLCIDPNTFHGRVYCRRCFAAMHGEDTADFFTFGRWVPEASPV